MRIARVALAALLVLTATPLFAGLTFDAVADFSVAGSNPNGVWTYASASVAGYLGTGAITPLPVGTPNVLSVGLNTWTPAAINLGIPATLYPHVLSSDTDQIQFGTVNYKADALTLHPGLGAGAGEIVLVRWTAPFTATFDLSYEFFTQDTNTGGDGVLVGPVLNIGQPGEFIPAGVVIDPAGVTSSAFAFPGLAFNAGDTVDFTVFRGGDSAQDSTGLRATFYTAVPEPGTYALVGCGLLGLAILRRRRKA